MRPLVRRYDNPVKTETALSIIMVPRRYLSAYHAQSRRGTTCNLLRICRRGGPSHPRLKYSCISTNSNRVTRDGRKAKEPRWRVSEHRKPETVATHTQQRAETEMCDAIPFCINEIGSVTLHSVASFTRE